MRIIEIDKATGVQSKNILVPQTSELLPNYPNPFNPSTNIPYVLSNRSKVTLEVFNIFGQRMDILVSGIQDAGRHTATWRALLPSGMYFAVLNSTDVDHPGQTVKSVRRMVLMK